MICKGVKSSANTSAGSLLFFLFVEFYTLSQHCMSAQYVFWGSKRERVELYSANRMRFIDGDLTFFVLLFFLSLHWIWLFVMMMNHRRVGRVTLSFFFFFFFV